VSLVSIVATVIAPVAVWWLAYPTPLLAAASTMAALVVIRHGDNVARLVAGAESKVMLKKQAAPTK